MEYRKAYIALPVLNELENLALFLQSLEKQQLQDYRLMVCVNQYDSWWDDSEKRAVCEDNAKSILFFKNLNDDRITLLDKSSQGKGWPDKKGGVGHARKTAMDYIAKVANDNDVIVSMDADTFYPEDYLSTLVEFFTKNAGLYGLALPYYHPLMNNKITDRLLLRYEMYMRYYALNMIRTHNPYRFSALGSAMAFPVWAYKKVGGLTPVQSGEDFYFLQKLVKAGPIGYTTNTLAYPSARFSDRVNFGTGPALIKGATGDWTSYPFYPFRFFDEVGETFLHFKELFLHDTPVPMDGFLRQQFGKENIWEPLRKNYRNVANFERACISRVDGLRILQYLRFRNSETSVKDEKVLKEFLLRFYKENLSGELEQIVFTLDFEQTPVKQTNRLRDFLFNMEKRERRQQMEPKA